MNALKGATYLPQLTIIDTDNTDPENQFHVMLMDELGSSLEDLFQEFKAIRQPFDVGTVCHIAVQLLKRVEAIHSAGIIHRDLKPANFLMGNSEATKNNIYVIDFGLSKFYRDGKGKHIPEK